MQTALKAAVQKGWPFIIHIEFAGAGEERNTYMAAMEAMVRKHPSHPFALIHMGQLQQKEVERLIRNHSNLYFLTSRANSVSAKTASHMPWTNMFKGNVLHPQWKTLILRNPDRFILAFDNVFARNWGKFYLKQIAVWRKALADLPSEVAHAIAHRNAERLWRLPSVN